MKKIIVFTLALFVVANIFAADSAKDKARIKRNDKWKSYVEKMGKKLSETDAAIFNSLRFEGFTPGNDWEYIKNTPSEKYKITNFETIQIPVEGDIALDGWFFPVPDAKGTVVVLHGYSSDAAFALYQSRFLLEKGYQLLIYNARFWKYSKTPEKYMLSLEKEMSDVGSVITYLKTRKDVDMNKLAIIGFSQGAYKSILAGARYKEFKVVMEDAGPTDRIWWGDRKDIIDGIKAKNGEDFTSKEYITTEVIATIAPRPVLILHGGKDTSVDLKDSQANFDKALEPKQFKVFPKSGHCLGMMTSDKDEYIKTVTDTLDAYLK